MLDRENRNGITNFWTSYHNSRQVQTRQWNPNQVSISSSTCTSKHPYCEVSLLGDQDEVNSTSNCTIKEQIAQEAKEKESTDFNSYFAYYAKHEKRRQNDQSSIVVGKNQIRNSKTVKDLTRILRSFFRSLFETLLQIRKLGPKRNQVQIVVLFGQCPPKIIDTRVH